MLAEQQIVLDPAIVVPVAITVVSSVTTGFAVQWRALRRAHREKEALHDRLENTALPVLETSTQVLRQLSDSVDASTRRMETNARSVERVVAALHEAIHVLRGLVTANASREPHEKEGRALVNPDDATTPPYRHDGS